MNKGENIYPKLIANLIKLVFLKKKDDRKKKVSSVFNKKDKMVTNQPAPGEPLLGERRDLTLMIRRLLAVQHNPSRQHVALATPQCIQIP